MLKKATLLSFCMAGSVILGADDKIAKRIDESTAVMRTIVNKQDIPKSIIEKAVCILIYPGVKKVGVGIGVTYGRGVMACHSGKDMTGKWSAPAMYTLDTGSLGAQLGSSSTDFLVLIMTQRAADKILSGKLKLGADASAVAGPNGAKAVGFNDPNVDAVTYSQAKGLFAGAAIGSASMASDEDANKDLYGKPVDALQIIRDGAVPVPAAGAALVALLNKTAPRRL